MRFVRRVGLGGTLLLASMVLASCASDDAGGGSTAATNAVASTTSVAGATSILVIDTVAESTVVDDTGELTPPTTGAIDPGLQPYIDLAVADLAGRLDIGIEDIEVVAATLVVWPDSSLGCPQPDTQYTQVETDGSQITLSVDGDPYDYHAGGDKTPFLCEPDESADKPPQETVTTP